MKNFILLSLAVILISGFIANPILDQEGPPYTYIISSENGKFLFKMFADGNGIAYQVTDDACNKEIWETGGWYAFKTFITNDGQYLVRIGNWPRGDRPSKDDLAIAFYEKDRLLKSYSTRDLIKDDSLVLVSVSHYKFMKEQPKLDYYNIYFTTVDGIIYKFDMTTGIILSQNKI